jgi:hypothetical protein
VRTVNFTDETEEINNKGENISIANSKFIQSGLWPVSVIRHSIFDGEFITGLTRGSLED